MSSNPKAPALPAERDSRRRVTEWQQTVSNEEQTVASREHLSTRTLAFAATLSGTHMSPGLGHCLFAGCTSYFTSSRRRSRSLRCGNWLLQSSVDRTPSTPRKLLLVTRNTLRGSLTRWRSALCPEEVTAGYSFEPWGVNRRRSAPLRRADSSGGLSATARRTFVTARHLPGIHQKYLARPAGLSGQSVFAFQSGGLGIC
jgi:hypothetical protein